MSGFPAQSGLTDARRDLIAAVAKCRAGLAGTLRELGEIERKLQDRAAAIRSYEESVAIFRETGHVLTLAHTVRHLGDVYYEAGRADLAEPCYREALDLYRAGEDHRPLDLANAIRSLAVLKDDAGQVDQAIVLWEEARALYGTLNVAAGVTECSRRIASLAGCRSPERPAE